VHSSYLLISRPAFRKVQARTAYDLLLFKSKILFLISVSPIILTSQGPISTKFAGFRPEVMFRSPEELCDARQPRLWAESTQKCLFIYLVDGHAHSQAETAVHYPGHLRRSQTARRSRAVHYCCALLFQQLVAWHSGRTSVSGRRTFPVLRSTCS